MNEIEKIDLDEFGLSEAEFRDELLAQAVISLAGGRVYGRIRMQKIVFLLDQMGFNSGFKYYYHHYGPYSEDLSRALDSAKVFRLIDEKIEYRSFDGARYSVFISNNKISDKIKSEIKCSDYFERTLTNLNERNSVVLELAATIVWISKYEKIQDWNSELNIRKGSKLENGRMDKAVHLLDELGISIRAG